MLQFYIADFLFVIPIFFSVFLSTIGYFQFNTTTSFVKSSSLDKKVVRTQVSKKNYNFVFINFIIITLCLLISQNMLFHGYSGSFWCNHLWLSIFTHRYINLFFKLALFIFLILWNLAVSRVYFSVDYVYSVSMILFMAPLIFLSNNFFVFYFVLELVVCLTFFKFTVSRFWYKSTLSFYTKASIEKYADYTPKMYVNALFFQYWASFFSSIILLYFFINLEFFFSSTEWTFINFAVNFIELPVYFYLYFFLFIIAFFLKLGVTPIHLYKVEVYKGLPYISVYIYTIFFFFFYFVFLLFLLLNYLNNFLVYFWFSFVILVLIGVFYVISMLFDVNFIKGFFAYSTIVNVISFLLVVLAAF